MLPSLKVLGTAAAVTLGLGTYLYSDVFSSKPPYYEAMTKQGVSLSKFNKIFDSLCEFSNEQGKGCGGDKNKDFIASILFREDDPLRTYETRLLALTSSVSLHYTFYIALINEKLLKNNNLLIIKQSNTETKASFDITSALTKSHNVYLHNFSEKTDKNICQVLKKYYLATGKLLDGVIIKGHGSKFGVVLDKSTKIHYEDFDPKNDLTRCFQKYLKNETPIIFSSCDTGNRAQSKEFLPSIGEVAAAQTGHPVFAPTQSLMDIECRYDINPLPVSEINIKCVKMVIDERYPSLKIGSYIKRFDPMNSSKI